VALTGYHIARRPRNATELNAKPQLPPPKSFPFASFVPLGVTLPEFNISRGEKKKKTFELFFLFLGY